MLFSAASVAVNILHAVNQAARAGWVAALVFAMPPVALVLTTHLLLQQGAWAPPALKLRHSGEPPAGGTAQLPPDSPQLYAESQAAGRKLTGAELGRALGISDSYGRLLLREFRASRTTTENGASKELWPVEDQNDHLSKRSPQVRCVWASAKARPPSRSPSRGRAAPSQAARPGGSVVGDNV